MPYDTLLVMLICKKNDTERAGSFQKRKPSGKPNFYRTGSKRLDECCHSWRRMQIDANKLAYISSAGLRILMIAVKRQFYSTKIMALKRLSYSSYFLSYEISEDSKSQPLDFAPVL